MNFIALGGIAQIDDYYAKSLHYCPLKGACATPLIEVKKGKDILFSKRPFLNKCLRFVYRF